MSAQQPGSSARPCAGDSTHSIACVICQAVYVPSRWHEHLLLASSIALESAFMGMCHFCFRCRRPACPECWDDVHGICAQCGQESQLPFRRVTAPLSSMLFTVSRHAQLEQEQPASNPLICITPGKFHSAQQNPIDERATAPVQAVEKEPGKQRRVKVDIEEMKTLPERKGKAGRGFERIVLIMLCIALGIVILLVAVTTISEDANTFITSTLHVDIHAEIAYLWQLIIHLFS